MFGSHTGELPRPKLKTPGLLFEVVSTLVFIVAVTALFDMAIPRSLVDGHSMEPTFYGDDRLVVSRVHYLLGQPQRGDILVFNSLRESELARGVMLIKRVVGLPGETIEMRNQQIHINGVALNETYIKQEACRRRCNDKSWRLAENEYFIDGRQSQQQQRFARLRPGAAGEDRGPRRLALFPTAIYRSDSKLGRRHERSQIAGIRLPALHGRAMRPAENHILRGLSRPTAEHSQCQGLCLRCLPLRRIRAGYAGSALARTLWRWPRRQSSDAGGSKAVVDL